MQIVRKCGNCGHTSSLQGNTRVRVLYCTCCGFNRPVTKEELENPYQYAAKAANTRA